MRDVHIVDRAKINIERNNRVTGFDRYSFKVFIFCVALSITKLSRLRAVLLEILPFLNVKVIWFLLREKEVSTL